MGRLSDVCGRYGLGKPEFSETRFKAPLPDVQPPLLLPRFNIAPTQDILTAATSKRLDGAPALKSMRWGLTPEWALADPRKPRPINVKTETLLDRPYFRRLLERKRCLIPADGFYEWNKRGDGKPWNIGLAGGEVFAFAGVWDATKNGDDWLVSAAILTCASNPLVGELHDRMPVILRPEDEGTWLADDAAVADLVPLLTPLDAERMDKYPVPPLVGNVANDSPQLRERVGTTAQASLF
jgi:putative SOS response-associated peptidase YedK